MSARLLGAGDRSCMEWAAALHESRRVHREGLLAAVMKLRLSCASGAVAPWLEMCMVVYYNCLPGTPITYATAPNARSEDTAKAERFLC